VRVANAGEAVARPRSRASAGRRQSPVLCLPACAQLARSNSASSRQPARLNVNAACAAQRLCSFKQSLCAPFRRRRCRDACLWCRAADVPALRDSCRHERAGTARRAELRLAGLRRPARAGPEKRGLRANTLGDKGQKVACASEGQRLCPVYSKPRFDRVTSGGCTCARVTILALPPELFCILEWISEAAFSVDDGEAEQSMQRR